MTKLKGSWKSFGGHFKSKSSRTWS